MDLSDLDHQSGSASRTGKSRLYSARQVVAAATLGSVLAGGWLLSRNLSYVGHDAASRIVVLGSIFLMVAIAVLASLVPSDFPNSPFIAVIGVLIYFGYQKYFALHFRRHTEAGGLKQSNWKVAGVAVLSLPLALAIMLVTFRAVPIVPMNYIPVGENYVYYEGNATRVDAKRLATFLTIRDVFQDASGWEVGVEIPRSKPNTVYLKDPMEKPPEVSQTYLAIQDLVAEAELELFPGRDVSFQILNEYGLRTLRIDNE